MPYNCLRASERFVRLFCKTLCYHKMEKKGKTKIFKRTRKPSSYMHTVAIKKKKSSHFP